MAIAMAATSIVLTLVMGFLALLGAPQNGKTSFRDPRANSPTK
jgi:hypothetical protein